MSEHVVTKRLRRAAIPLALLGGVVGSILLSSAPAEGGAPVCPATSAPDRWGTATADLASKCVFTVREGLVQRGEIAHFNVYCPTRLSMAEAAKLGREIGSGRWDLANGNPIAGAYKNTRPALYADFQQVSHLFHYGCVSGGRPGVATHLKLSYRGHDPRAADNVARACLFQGSQNGGVAIGARIDREYFCAYPIHSTDGRDFARGVATKVIGRDMWKQVDDIGGKICMLASTDAQCAPCRWTEKLVARMQIVSRNGKCPAGTYDEVEEHHRPSPP